MQKSPSRCFIYDFPLTITVSAQADSTARQAGDKAVLAQAVLTQVAKTGYLLPRIALAAMSVRQ